MTSRKKGARPKWTIYKHKPDRNVSNSGILSVYSVPSAYISLCRELEYLLKKIQYIILNRLSWLRFLISNTLLVGRQHCPILLRKAEFWRPKFWKTEKFLKPNFGPFSSIFSQLDNNGDIWMQVKVPLLSSFERLKSNSAIWVFMKIQILFS